MEISCMARPRKSKTRTEVPSTPSTPSSAEAAPTTEEKDEKAEQYVSIAAELGFIGRAVDGAVLLTDALAEDAAFSSDATERIPPAVIAVLSLVHARLDQVQRVLRGSSDPKRILAPHNLTGAPSPGEDPDVTLSVWNHAQRVAYHSRELHMAESETEIAARREG
jgi:hypothetical protein